MNGKAIVENDLRLGSLKVVQVLVRPRCISSGVAGFQFLHCGNEHELTQIYVVELCNKHSSR